MGVDMQLLAGPWWHQGRWKQRAYLSCLIAAGWRLKFSSSSLGPADTTPVGKEDCLLTPPSTTSVFLFDASWGWKLNCAFSTTGITLVGKAQGHLSCLTATRWNHNSSSPRQPHWHCKCSFSLARVGQILSKKKVFCWLLFSLSQFGQREIAFLEVFFLSVPFGGYQWRLFQMSSRI